MNLSEEIKDLKSFNILVPIFSWLLLTSILTNAKKEKKKKTRAHTIQ
jgi:hypothetical protein